jgi:hypothetical protein
MKTGGLKKIKTIPPPTKSGSTFFFDCFCFENMFLLVEHQPVMTNLCSIPKLKKRIATSQLTAKTRGFRHQSSSLSLPRKLAE